MSAGFANRSGMAIGMQSRSTAKWQGGHTVGVCVFGCVRACCKDVKTLVLLSESLMTSC